MQYAYDWISNCKQARTSRQSPVITKLSQTAMRTFAYIAVDKF